jgi:hypothetical protein
MPSCGFTGQRSSWASLTVGLVAVCRVKFAGETRDAVASLYPTAEEARINCAIVDAAA